MKRKVTPFAENIAESTTACLVTMVQGNLLALTLGHLLIAAQTGIIAGAVASGVFLIVGTGKRWITSTFLGVATAVVDYFVHPGQFGPVAMEAAVTGVAAAVLSYVIGGGVELLRSKYLVKKGEAPEKEVAE
ncbi:MAG: hypothetical protein O7C67_04750 [Gammaproteobacteria bacterium]|nr:hypothetical protein [Gammaproteobacteria bacterium]